MTYDEKIAELEKRIAGLNFDKPEDRVTALAHEIYHDIAQLERAKRANEEETRLLKKVLGGLIHDPRQPQ